MKTIEVIVDTKGQTRVETKGFTGPECLAASRFLEQALGVRTTEHLTGEFYQSQRHDENLKQSS